MEKIKEIVKKSWKGIVSVLTLGFIWRLYKAYTYVRIVENKELEKEIKTTEKKVEIKKKEIADLKVHDKTLSEELDYWENNNRGGL